MTVQHLNIPLPLCTLLYCLPLQPKALHCPDTHPLQIVLNVNFTHLLHANAVPKLLEFLI